jgi:PucR C-terminal helix-turn-helix domain
MSAPVPLTRTTGSGCAAIGLQAQLFAPGGAADIHPQTARYRMNQLRRMFGPALDDPDTRFELEMALRARRMLRAAH